MTAPAQDLVGCRSKIEWAKGQIPSIRAQINAFLATRPFVMSQTVDAAANRKLIRMGATAPVPEAISTAVGLAIHALRSSLDLLAVALARRNGMTNTRDVYFPISKTEAVFLSDGLEKIKRLSAADQAIIKALLPFGQPTNRYGEANHDLCALHELDRIDKHSDLIELGGRASAGINFLVGDIKLHGSRYHRLTDNPVLAEISLDTIHAPIEYRVDIGFPMYRGYPVVELLLRFVDLVTDIVDQFDPATAKPKEEVTE
jgi:hypothetical protein